MSEAVVKISYVVDLATHTFSIARLYERIKTNSNDFLTVPL